MTPKKFLKFCLLSLALCYCFYLMYANNSTRNNTTVVYYVPEDFQGKCYHIYYNHKGEPPLIPKKKEDGYELVIKYPADGKFLTSSDGETFPRLGWYKVKAYIVNKEGVFKGEIPPEDVGGGLTNSSDRNAFSTDVFDGSGYCH